MAGRGSFDEFYAGAVGRLVGQLFPVTGDLHEAEEVAQEAFTRAARPAGHGCATTTCQKRGSVGWR
jgi:DNA-directed RNA polymerase specialized sigma24 family protein